jgi:hypothetical protein
MLSLSYPRTFWKAFRNKFFGCPGSCTRSRLHKSGCCSTAKPFAVEWLSMGLPISPAMGQDSRAPSEAAGDGPFTKSVFTGGKRSERVLGASRRFLRYLGVTSAIPCKSSSICCKRASRAFGSSRLSAERPDVDPGAWVWYSLALDSRFEERSRFS